MDLIMGHAGQTLDDWIKELRFTMDIVDDHLSLYHLTVEPGTAYVDRVCCCYGYVDMAFELMTLFDFDGKNVDCTRMSSKERRHCQMVIYRRICMRPPSRYQAPILLLFYATFTIPCSKRERVCVSE